MTYCGQNWVGRVSKTRGDLSFRGSRIKDKSKKLRVRVDPTHRASSFPKGPWRFGTERVTHSCLWQGTGKPQQRGRGGKAKCTNQKPKGLRIWLKQRGGDMQKK